jgi:actin-related protein 8
MQIPVGSSKSESDVQPTGGANDADSASNHPEASGMAVDLVDVDEESKAPETQPSTQAQSAPTQPAPSAPLYPGGYPIDVSFEASKLPLDVAIFNSARAAGGDEKIRKYLQAVLVIGGTALIPGTAYALESR